MPEETRQENEKTQETTDQLSEITNKLKELERKNEELLKQLEEQRRLNLELLAKTTDNFTSGSSFQPVEKETTTMDEDLNQLFYTDPAKAIKKILEKEKEVLKQELPKEVSSIAVKVYQRQMMIEEAKRRYPELNDPTSEFYKEVANFMYQRPHLYDDPEGILLACARVAEEMRLKNPNIEKQRKVISSTTVEGATSETPSVPQLDAQGLELAQKLGIDPKKYAERLERYLKQEGEYKKQHPGLKYKARL